MAESHRYVTRASLRGRIDQGREGLSHDVFRESDTSTPAPLAQPEDVRIGPSISESRISSDEETAGDGISQTVTDTGQKDRGGLPEEGGEGDTRVHPVHRSFDRAPHGSIVSEESRETSLASQPLRGPVPPHTKVQPDPCDVDCKPQGNLH